jgi:hypothetical protein
MRKYVALRSLQILYNFVVRAQIATIFGPTLQGYIFRILQHFATKLCNFTNFSMLFPGIYFFCQDKKLVNNSHYITFVSIFFDRTS